MVMATKKKNIVSQADAMEQAIRKNPTPELIAAYKEFFGKEISIDVDNKKTTAKKTNSKVKTLPNRNRRIEEDDEEDEFYDVDDEEEVFENALKRRPRKKKREGKFEKQAKSMSFTPPKKMKFESLDDDRDSELIEAKSFDAKLKKKGAICPRTPRRGKFSLVLVRCRSCGDEDEISPSLVPPSRRWLCNSCSVSGGR